MDEHRDPYEQHLGILGRVDWAARLARERPLLEEVLTTAPSRRVLDLGCGTGEHARLLVEAGFELVGIDASEERLARAEAAGGGPSYVRGEIGAIEAGVRGQFGAALCLGDTLPYLIGTEALGRMLVGLRRRLLPDAPVVLQLLNYARIFARRERHLPLQLAPGEEGDEVLILRLLDPRPDDILILTASALRYTAGGEPPLEVLASRSTYLQAWTYEQLEILLDVARFPERRAYGSLEREPFDPDESTDLIIVAR